MKRVSNTRGFTLIEMLLSLLIFGMLGLATYSVLNNTMDGHEAVVAQNEHLTELHRAMTIIDSDFSQLTQRFARIGGDEPSNKLFHAEQYLFDSDEIGFGFVRDGWRNPAMVLPRSELQPVAYRVKEGELQRLYYNFVDPDTSSEPRVQPLMRGISEMKIQYKVEQQWQEDWDNEGLPELIKLSFKSETFGQIERVFAIVRKSL